MKNIGSKKKNRKVIFSQKKKKNETLRNKVNKTVRNIKKKKIIQSGGAVKNMIMLEPTSEVYTDFLTNKHEHEQPVEIQITGFYRFHGSYKRAALKNAGVTALAVGTAYAAPLFIPAVVGSVSGVASSSAVSGALTEAPIFLEGLGESIHSGVGKVNQGATGWDNTTNPSAARGYGMVGGPVGLLAAAYNVVKKPKKEVSKEVKNVLLNHLVENPKKMDTKSYQFSIFYSPSTKRKVLIERSERKGDRSSVLDNKNAEYRYQFLSKMLIFKLPRTGGMAMELKKNDPNLKKDNDIGQIISSNVYVILFVLNIEKNNWQILTDKFSNGFTPENVLQGYVIDKDKKTEDKISDLVEKYNIDKSNVLVYGETEKMKELKKRMITTIRESTDTRIDAENHPTEKEQDVKPQQSDSEEIELIEDWDKLKVPALQILTTQFVEAEQKPEEEVSELKYLESIDKHLKNIYDLLNVQRGKSVQNLMGDDQTPSSLSPETDYKIQNKTDNYPHLLNK